MEPSPQKILFVVNSNSGGKNKQDFETQIKTYFEKLPDNVNYYHLNGSNNEAGIKKEIDTFNPKKVVAVGGDGTVNLVAKVIMGSDIHLGIIPGGSANGMAKELAIPTVFNDMMTLIMKGESKRADIIKINENDICLHLSDIGLNARLIKYFEEGNMRGKLGYAKVAFRVLWRRQHIQVIIKSADNIIKRNAFMVVLANASKYGTGAVINPEGDLYDGFFEVVIIRQLAIFDILKMWFKPKPFNKKNIEIIKGCSVHIITGHKVHFQVDGEYKGKVKEVKAEMLAHQLNLIVPKEITP
ncbi:MAG: diacylglycerol kinase family lipid kinase [Chitinophagaceae bacterium]|nr:diacylglycerol kinase family lipid kinase [Chitinophagaceae bacterium]